MCAQSMKLTQRLGDMRGFGGYVEHLGDRQGEGSWRGSHSSQSRGSVNKGAEVRGSTPARSCSQRWGSRAAGRTRRSGGGAGGTQGGTGRKLEPGGGRLGRRAGIHPRTGTSPPAGGAREAAASALRAPCFPGSLTRAKPSGPGSSPALPSVRPGLTRSAGGPLRIAPALHRHAPALGGDAGWSQGQKGKGRGLAPMLSQ